MYSVLQFTSFSLLLVRKVNKVKGPEVKREEKKIKKIRKSNEKKREILRPGSKNKIKKKKKKKGN